jgi:hypothetical protein
MLHAINTSHRKKEAFIYEYPLQISPFAHIKTHNIKLLFDNTLLMHGRHFVYRNQPVNMRMRVWYLDGYEAGLCCYLVIHMENILRPLQLFYLHL